MIIMRQCDFYPNFIERETHSEKGRNLFRVIPLGSSRTVIKTQVCLLPNHSVPEKHCERLRERLLTRKSNSCTWVVKFVSISIFYWKNDMYHFLSLAMSRKNGEERD